MKYSSLFKGLACGVLVIAGMTIASAQTSASPSNYTPGGSADDVKVQHMIENGAPSSGLINAGNTAEVNTAAKLESRNGLKSRNGVDVNASPLNLPSSNATRLERLQAARQYALDNGLPTERYDAAIEELTNQN